MKYFSKKLSFNWLILLLPLFSSGCLGKPSQVNNYYLYSPVKESEVISYPELEMEDREIIAIGPVKLPPELEQAGIVVKSGGRSLQISRTRVWAASLDELIATALARNLSIILGTDKIDVYPGFGIAELRYQILLEVNEFSGDLKKEFNCEIVWSLIDKEEDKIMVRQKFVSNLPLEEADYEMYVAAASRSLVGLARDIVKVLPDVDLI